jgi:outer membrane immunogenic protein
MYKTAFGIALLPLVISTPLFAADLPQADMAVVSEDMSSEAGWTGFYFGLSGGASFENSSTITRLDGTVRAHLTDIEGFSAGIQTGYDFQLDRLLIGLAADVTKPFATKHFDLGKGKDIDVSYDYLATMRAKIGFLPTTNLAVYGTAGLAVMRTELHYVNPPFDITQSENNTGYVFGGGLEYKHTSNFSVFTEYREYQFSKTEYLDLLSEAESESSEIRIGINYRF